MQQALIDFLSSGGLESGVGLPPGAHSRQQITIETIFRALDLVPTPILVGMNPDSTDIRSNAAGRALFGGGDRNLSQTAAQADRPDFLVYSAGRPVPPDQLPMQRAALTGEAVQAPECELRFDSGVVKYIRGKAVPVFGRDGSVRGSIGVFIDITEARETEKRHALMTEEVKHRAKNTLALVQSIASLTLRPKLDRDAYADFENRLRVIGHSIDVFAVGDSSAETVTEIIATTLRRQIGSQISRVRMSGPEILMPLSAVASLGMAIHELTTNACKYGAFSAPGGSVSIEWRELGAEGVLALDWIERGGPPVTPPARRGFGSRLLAQVLGSPAGLTTEIRFNEEGVECRMYVALS